MKRKIAPESYGKDPRYFLLETVPYENAGECRLYRTLQRGIRPSYSACYRTSPLIPRFRSIVKFLQVHVLRVLLASQSYSSSLAFKEWCYNLLTTPLVKSKLRFLTFLNYCNTIELNERQLPFRSAQLPTYDLGIEYLRIIRRRLL